MIQLYRDSCRGLEELHQTDHVCFKTSAVSINTLNWHSIKTLIKNLPLLNGQLVVMSQLTLSLLSTDGQLNVNQDVIRLLVVSGNCQWLMVVQCWSSVNQDDNQVLIEDAHTSTHKKNAYLSNLNKLLLWIVRNGEIWWFAVFTS